MPNNRKYSVICVFKGTVNISENRNYEQYLHFSKYCPYICPHVYHKASVVVRSGHLQVVGMSSLTLYFAYEPCLMDVSYQLSPVNFPSESSPLPSLGIELTLFCVYLTLSRK